MSAINGATETTAPPGSALETLRVFLKLGLTSFGGQPSPPFDPTPVTVTKPYSAFVASGYTTYVGIPGNVFSPIAGVLTTDYLFVKEGRAAQGPMDPSCGISSMARLSE